MNRALTMLAATACAALAISSACLAAEWTMLPFQLAKTKDAGRVQFGIRHQGKRGTGNWSQTLALAELPGLGSAQLGGRTATPVRFSLTRPAGRFDCAGSVRSSEGQGHCAFSADAGLADLLDKRGIGRPTRDQSYHLAVANFRPGILDTLAAAGYARPTIDQSIALGIFRIDPAYVRGLAEAGVRSGTVDDLIAMRIHQVTPTFVARFARLGYRDLTADRLVQLRIFGVKAEDVRALQARGIAAPTTDQLVQRRVFGTGHLGRRDGD